MLNRRTFNFLPLLGAAPMLAWAQVYPSKPIRLVAAFSPGTSTDALARYIGQQMSKSLGVSVVVENKVGAGGMIATDFVAKSPPDGYSVLFTTASFYALPYISEKLPYDAFNDFAAVAAVAQAGLVLAVGPDSPFTSIRELIAEAKKKPGSLSYATSGLGSTTHMGGAAFNAAAGTDIRAVHYKVATQASIDASTGQVSMVVSGFAAAVALMKAGKLRPLAITNLRRSDLLPDVPTLAESGLSKFEVVTPVLAFARAGTPRPILEGLSKTILAALATPEYKALCVALVLDVASIDEATLGAGMPQEFVKWKTLADLATKQG